MQAEGQLWEKGIGARRSGHRVVRVGLFGRSESRHKFTVTSKMLKKSANISLDSY